MADHVSQQQQAWFDQPAEDAGNSSGEPSCGSVANLAVSGVLILRLLPVTVIGATVLLGHSHGRSDKCSLDPVPIGGDPLSRPCGSEVHEVSRNLPGQ